MIFIVVFIVVFISLIASVARPGRRAAHGALALMFTPP